MSRRLALILTTISLVFLPLFFVPKVSAWEIGDPINSMETLDEAIQGNGLDKNLQDFCAKRQGNQMNLETWYSGKCTDDTFSGDGVGFSDIVILDLAEKVLGKKDPSNTFWDTLQKVIDEISVLPENISPESRQIAINSAREKLSQNQDSGLLGQVGKMISMLYQNQPASTTSYLAYITQNLQKHKIIPPALAANGIGFETFSPFLTIWIAFRNLAYLGIIAFFIIYGFMMMFRVNLGQKTVISVQLAIPKLIVTLLIITFSFAIVGLLYDLMWVFITFIFGYLESQKILFMTGVGSLGLLASGFSKGSLPGSLIINSAVSVPAGIFGILNLIFGGSIGAITSVITTVLLGWLVVLFMVIAILIAYVKLFFKLISAFISVVVSLVLSPLILLGNALPGSTVIGTWMRGIIANLAVFPITILLLFFSYLLMVQPLVGMCQDNGLLNKMGTLIWPNAEGTTCENLWGVKSLVAKGNDDTAGIPLITPESGTHGVSARGLLALIGVGLLLMASKYVDIVRDALKVPPFKYGSDIASALQAPIKMAGTAYKYGKEAIKLL